VSGAQKSWRKPRFSPDGQRLLFLDSENREAVVIASSGPDAKSAGSLAWASGGGSPVVAATFSPDGKYVAWAVGLDKDAGGGVWVAPVASPTTPKHIFKADLRTLWNCDLAWAK
jgi:Tol biopolymer transport system component